MVQVTAEQNSPRPPQGGEGVGEGGKVVAFVGFGSNLGDREQNIFDALKAISFLPDTLTLGVSSLVETRPVGSVQNQPNFLNGVVAVETTLYPFELLDQLLLIETRLGRVRCERWGPRIIDLDILFYGNQKIDHPRLVVPHSEIRNRPFIQEAIDELRQKGIVPLTQTLSPKGARGSS